MGIGRLTTSSTQAGFPKYNKLWDGTSAIGAMEAISFINLTSTQSYVSFNNIPQNYTHLHLRFSHQYRTALDIFQIRFNNDSGTNYSQHRIWAGGNGSTSTGIYNYTSQAFIDAGFMSNSSTTFTTGIIDILDYANTNKLKTVRHFGGVDLNGDGYISVGSGLWSKAGSGVTSDAINSILLYPSVGAFQQYSTFSLYGVK